MTPATAAGVLSGLAEPARRRLVEVLADGERSAGELVGLIGSEFSISQSAVSQHLTVLRGCGLVRVRPQGSRRLYALDPAGLEVLRGWLTRFEDVFSQPLDALATELARGRRQRTRPDGDAATRPDVVDAERAGRTG